MYHGSARLRTAPLTCCCDCCNTGDLHPDSYCMRCGAVQRERGRRRRRRVCVCVCVWRPLLPQKANFSIMRLKECVFNKRLLIKDRVHHPADNRQVALCARLQGGAGADGMFVLQQLRISFKGLISNISASLSAAASRAAASSTSTLLHGNVYIYIYIYLSFWVSGGE